MRLIDADALKKALEEQIESYEEIDWETGAYHDVIVNFIGEAPTIDAVPVVRCKDCRFYNTTGCQTGFGWCESPVVSTGVYDEWYCADGERKDDATND